MKKFIYFVLLLCFIPSCSSQSEYEKLLTDFIEIRGNVRTDLNVKFQSIEVSDITVGDSVQILKKQFESEKADLVMKQEKEVERYKKQIAEIETKTSQDIADIVILKGYKEKLYDCESDLKKAKNWTPDYLNKYDSRASDEILIKKAICTFSVLDPKLQTRQTYKDALFILSADGKTPLRAILSE